MTNKPKKVVVLGSWHKVIFVYGDRIPNKGETVPGKSYTTSYGGKGGNMAFQCSYLGGNCNLIQKLGDDEAGHATKKIFEDFGVTTNYVKLDPNESTGFAPIFIDKNGENAIMIVTGAHGHYTKQDIDDAEEAFKDAFMAGFVLETNYDVTEYAIKKAHAMGVQVFLDPAPAMEINPEIYKYLTWIKPNEHEASLLSGIKVIDYDSAVKAGKWFLKMGVKNALVTMGGTGTVLVTPGREKLFTAPKVEVLDTTCAGDIFAGSFIYALSVDMSVDEAIDFASCAGALAVTIPGSMAECAPSNAQVTKLYKEFTGK